MGVSGLLGDILCHGFRFRRNIVSDRSIKQGGRGARIPAPICSREFNGIQMAEHTRHGNIALSPRRTKITAKPIILDISVTRDITLSVSESVQDLEDIISIQS